MPGNEILMIPPAHDLAPAAAGAEVDRLVAEAAAFIDAAKASNTRRAYHSAWRAFEVWCAEHSLDPLPAKAGTLAFYLTDRQASLSVASLSLHRAAVADRHRGEDLSPPDSAALRAVWDGIRRKKGRPPRKKRALVAADLRRVVKRLPDTLRGKRDKALLLVGWAAALRRCELAALEMEAGRSINAPLRVRFVNGGVEVVVERSKGDQTGHGAIVAIPHGTRGETCPVAALNAWLSTAGITDGPIFRGVDRGDRIASSALNDRAVARIVKAAVRAAGFACDPFAGHSLRSGMITSAARAGVCNDVLQRHARHARWDTTREYIQAAERFKHNAVGKML